MQPTTVEKGYQEYAWILIAIVGVAYVVDGLAFFAGVNTDPPLFQSLIGQSLSSFNTSFPKEAAGMTHLFHGFGLFAMGLGLFTIAVSYKPYRKGEKWSWYITWCIPIVTLLAAIANYTDEFYYTLRAGLAPSSGAPSRLPCRTAAAVQEVLPQEVDTQPFKFVMTPPRLCTAQ